MNSAALRRIWPLIAVGALLLATAIAVGLSSPQVRRAPFTPPRVGPGRRRTGGETPFYAPGAPNVRPTKQPKTIELGWLSGVLEVLCAVAVVVITGVLVFLLVRSSLRTRKAALPADPPPTAVDQRQEVLAAVEAGLSDLDDDDRDPRRAVIACWVRLEQAAAAAGTPREPGDTPTDLVVRLLGAHRVSAPVLYRMADVYRLARYATHTVDSAMRDQARAALRQLRGELTLPVSS